MTTKIKAILNSVWLDIVDTYKRSKVFLLGLVAIVAVIEWSKIKEMLLAYGVQKDVSKAKVQDQTIAQQETTENQQANNLVQEANSLPSQDTQPIDENWYKKDQS